MGHIPDDDNYDEFMNASAEEWSKPEEPSKPDHELGDELTDRWGSVIPEEGAVSRAERWGSERLEPSNPGYDSPDKKKKSTRWLIIAAVVLVVLCLCLCIGLVAVGFGGMALPFGGMELFQMFQ